jgi:hypothetical protein
MFKPTQPLFRAIPQFTASPDYAVTVPWQSIDRTLDDYKEPYGLDLDPDFQRGHVWTEEQQIAYIEFILSGGKTGRELLLNQSSFAGRGGGGTEPMVLVDGKQRLTAVQRFLHDEIPAFGYFYHEFGDKIRMSPSGPNFTFRINDLKTREAVLKWYLEINSGGTPHSKEEIMRVSKLLEEARQTQSTSESKGKMQP